MWVMNHLKQHLRVWHCKHFAIWGFIKDKWGFIKDQFLIVGQLFHQEKNIYGALLMCKDRPAHQWPSLPISQRNEKEETKTCKASSTQISSDQHVGKGHIIFSRKLPTKFSCFYLIYLAVPSLPPSHFLLHCLSFFHPVIWCILLSYLPSLLHFKSSGLLTLVFFSWTGLPKLRGKTAHPKDELTLLLSFPVG